MSRRALFIFFLMLVVVIGLAVLLRRNVPQPKTKSQSPTIEQKEPGKIPRAHRSAELAAPITNGVEKSFWDGLHDDEGKPVKPSRAQMDAYLAMNNRRPASLLAAFEVMEDKVYLHEAVANFPNDPKVQLAVLTEDLFPDERRKWLDLFQQSSPGNPLADYLSAQEFLKKSDTESALAALLAAHKKPGFDALTLDRFQNREELYLASGHSPVQAKVLAMDNVISKLLPSMKSLSVQMTALQKQYAASGDAASADNLAAMTIHLGRNLSEGTGGRFLIDQMIGQSFERRLLNQLDPNRRYEFLGKTAGERIAEMEAEKKKMKDLLPMSAIVPMLPETEVLVYFDRVKLYGELNALIWLKEKHGER